MENLELRGDVRRSRNDAQTACQVVADSKLKVEHDFCPNSLLALNRLRDRQNLPGVYNREQNKLNVLRFLTCFKKPQGVFSKNRSVVV